MPYDADLFDDIGVEQDNFDSILKNTLEHEGGYTVDHAGPTNKGITQATFDKYRSDLGLPSKSVKDIRDDETYDVYRSDYYEKPNINKLPKNVAGVIFDFGVNSSPDRAIKTLQRTVGAEPDGDLGPQTLKAVDQFIADKGEPALVEGVINKRQSFLSKLIKDKPAKYGKFENGWNNRIQRLKEQYLKPLAEMNPLQDKEAGADEIPADQQFDADLFDEPVQEFDANLFDEEPKKSRGIVESAGEVVKGSLRGLQGIAAGTGGLIDMAGQNIQRQAEKVMFLSPDIMPEEEKSKRFRSMMAVGKKVSEWGKTAKEYWNRASSEGIAAPDPETFKGTFMQNPSWTRAASIVAEAVPSLGAATAASAAAGGNPIVGLAFLGSLEGEPAFAESRKAGKGVEDANRLFGMSALGTSVLEVLPLTRFLEGGEGKLAKDMFIGGAQEGGEEALQNLWQNMIAKIGYDKTRSLTEGMAESIIGGAGSGAAMGGLTSGRPAKLDKEIKQAIDAGVPPVAIDVIQETLANQIISNADAVEKAITEKPIAKLEEVSKDVAEPTGISVNITPEMKQDIEKSNLSEERRSEIIKLLEKPEDTAQAETAPTVSIEGKGEDKTPPINLGEPESKEVTTEPKPQDFKTAEQSSKVKEQKAAQGQELAIVRSDKEKSDASILDDYLSSLEAGGTIRKSEFSDGPSTVIGRDKSARPKWWQSLGISMPRTRMVLKKFYSGEKLTETQQRDYNKLVDAATKNEPELFKEALSIDEQINNLSKELKNEGFTDEQIKEAIVIGEKTATLESESLKKQPWQLTKEDYAFGEPDDQSNAEHRAEVEQALKDGNKVPENVMKDYPDLSGRITPSGQVRLELRAPLKTELFQEKGELFKEAEKVSETSETTTLIDTVIQDFGEKIGGARKDTAERGFQKTTIKKDKAGPAWANKFIAAEKVDKSGWVLIKKDAPTWMIGNIRDSQQKFATKEEAEKAIPIKVVSETHRVFQNKANKWEIFKRVGERKLFKVVNKEFESREEAMKHMALNAEDILNIKTTFGEEILPVPEIAVRKGIERRKGNATPEMFMETFLPRGIEFGNWNNQDERQLVLNHAYDGLLDLADILGISPKDLMLGGELGIAFGARGQGLSGAKAHFEPDYNAINLTKMKGAGSLAHEWFHALDNYLAKLDGKAKTEKVENDRGDLVFPYRSNADVQLSFGASYNSKLDKDLLESYTKLINTLFKKAEKYVENTEVADKFLSAARGYLKEKLDGIRASLAKDYSQEYTWRKSKKGLKAASTEQLAEFDRLANTLIEGGNLETKFIKIEGSKNIWGGRQSNETLEAMNDIIKSVRNRSGFQKEQDGSLDNVAAAMRTYASRLNMFKEAQSGTEKIKNVPTNYAIEAKKMDQARAGEYWSNPNEMIARAFAAYVEDKVAQKGWQSDFIVYHAHGGILVPMIDGFVGRPYPEGAEREVITNELDIFIEKARKIFKDKSIEKAASGEENVIVTKEEHKAAGERINSKLRRLSANPMLDPELWADLLKVGTFHLERGARTFSAWSDRMANEFGESIKPYLDNIWNEITAETPKTDIPPMPTKSTQGDKTAKAALDINRKAVDKGISEIPEDDLASYASINKQEQLDLVAQMLTNDPEGTKDMALGKKPMPTGISPQVVFNAVKNKAIIEGDAETIKALANSPVASERSLLAQKLGAAGYDNGMSEADPIKAVNEIAKVREENKAEINKKVSELEEKLAKAEKALSDAMSKQAVKTRTRSDFGSKNVVFKKDALDSARLSLRKKLGLGSLRSGVDPTALIELTQIGGFYFEGGMREFSSWSSELVKEFGSKIEPYLKPAWDNIKKELSATKRDIALSKVMSLLASGEKLSDISISIQPLAEYLISEGVETRDELVDSIHALLIESGQNVTKREVADAISGYGKFKPLTDNEIQAKLRDIKGQLQQVSKIEDLQRKIAPAKTGIERRSPSDEERRLIKQVEELKKQSGIVSLDPTRQLKSALESIKTRLSNQIKDLEKQIADGKKIVKEKRTVELDKEAKELIVRRDELKREFDAIFTKPGLTDQQRIDIATRSVARSITILENKIKAGDISVKQKPDPVTSKALEALRARREDLKANLQELRDIANPPKSDEQKAIDALKSRLISQKNKLEKQIADNDFVKAQKPAVIETPEIKFIRKSLEETKNSYNAAKSMQDGITDEELQIIVDMSKKVYDAKDKMNPDFTWNDKQDGIEYGAANVAFKKYVAKLKADAKGSDLVNPLEGKNLAEKYQRTMKDFAVIFNFVADNSKAILGSIDNSFHGRQGRKAMLNPQYSKAWFDSFVRSWGSIWDTIKGGIGKSPIIEVILGKDAIKAGEIITDSVIIDAYSRKNYLNGRYNKGVKLDIATGEEAFPTSLPARIPILGRLFKASEAAYEASAMRLRLDIADILYQIAENSGQDMNDKQIVGDINQIANELTGRGSLGRFGSGKAINRTFFSIKNAKSNVDFLLRPFYPNQSEFARREAAKNLLYGIGSTAVLLMLASLLNDDDNELDPRGDMFGKIRLGNGVVIDITGGVSGFVILAARIFPTRNNGKWGMMAKNSKTGIIKPVGESFGDPDGSDMLVNFAMNKLSPIAATMRDYLRQRNFDNKKPTFTSTATGLVTPIPAQNVIDLSSKDESNTVKLVSLILDGLGFGMSYRDMSQDWEGKTSNEMITFKEVVGEKTFKQANDQYNDLINERIDHVLKSKEYKDLEDEEKLRIIKTEREKAKDSILRSYGFKYKREKLSPVSYIQ